MSVQSRTLWLVRHGDTVWSATGRIAGRSDIDLSEAGRDRVAQLARTATMPIRYGQWFSSPMQRTRQTTHLLRRSISQLKGVDSLERDGDHERAVRFDERLVELDFGDWEGRTWESVHESQGDELAEWGANWVDTGPPGGESFRQQYDRCAAWLDEWQGSPDRVSDVSAAPCAVVVTHGGCLRALLCRMLERPLQEAMRWSVDLACVYRFSWYEGEQRWLLRTANHQSF